MASRRFRRLHNRSLKKSLAFVSCTCFGRSREYVYLRWPLFISRNVTQVHDSNCPHAIYQAAMTDVNIRFSICSTALRRKIEFGIAVSQGLGVSSICPSLISYRVVPETSPGFLLLKSFLGNVYEHPTNAYWTGFAQNLFQLFQNGEASPHDRLVNGETVLHVGYILIQALTI